MNPACLVVIVVGLVMLAGQRAQAVPVPALRPLGPALEVSPPFAFDKKKTRRSASGIACAPASAGAGAGQRCLVVFDEGTKAQFARLVAGRLQPFGTLIELSDAAAEIDAEGAALAGGFYYVTGSHSVKRESCKSNPASRVVIRFRATVPAASPPRVEVSERLSTTRLWDLMREDPYLRPHVDACLGNGEGGSPAQMQGRPGINIEGLAVAGGRLYAGFRGPSEGGLAPVFSVDAKALFEGGDAQPRLDRLDLGQRIGIRDMVAARNSILLLLGPDDHEAGVSAVWKVAEWKPGATAKPQVLAVLDVRKQDIGKACFEALKPEALAIVDESSKHFRVVVLSDGVCDGGPLIFDVSK